MYASRKTKSGSPKKQPLNSLEITSMYCDFDVIYEGLQRQEKRAHT